MKVNYQDVVADSGSTGQLYSEEWDTSTNLNPKFALAASLVSEYFDQSEDMISAPSITFANKTAVAVESVPSFEVRETSVSNSASPLASSTPLKPSLRKKSIEPILELYQFLRGKPAFSYF